MSAYTGGTTQFLGGVAQFESSVEQMKISSMITVMEKITELGIQAAQEKGSSSIIGYSRIFSPSILRAKQSVSSSRAVHIIVDQHVERIFGAHRLYEN